MKRRRRLRLWLLLSSAAMPRLLGDARRACCVLTCRSPRDAGMTEEELLEEEYEDAIEQLEDEEAAEEELEEASSRRRLLPAAAAVMLHAC